MEPTMTENSSGTKRWKLNGILHRTDGHVFENTDSYKEYWIEGKQYTEKEFMDKVK